MNPFQYLKAYSVEATLPFDYANNNPLRITDEWRQGRFVYPPPRSTIDRMADYFRDNEPLPEAPWTQTRPTLQRPLRARAPPLIYSRRMQRANKAVATSASAPASELVPEPVEVVTVAPNKKVLVEKGQKRQGKGDNRQGTPKKAKTKAEDKDLGELVGSLLKAQKKGSLAAEIAALERKVEQKENALFLSRYPGKDKEIDDLLFDFNTASLGGLAKVVEDAKKASNDDDEDNDDLNDARTRYKDLYSERILETNSRFFSKWVKTKSLVDIEIVSLDSESAKSQKIRFSQVFVEDLDDKKKFDVKKKTIEFLMDFLKRVESLQLVGSELRNKRLTLETENDKATIPERIRLAANIAYVDSVYSKYRDIFDGFDLLKQQHKKFVDESEKDLFDVTQAQRQAANAWAKLALKLVFLPYNRQKKQLEQAKKLAKAEIESLKTPATEKEAAAFIASLEGDEKDVYAATRRMLLVDPNANLKISVADEIVK